MQRRSLSVDLNLRNKVLTSTMKNYILIASFLLLFFSLNGQTVFVSPDGVNSNDGSLLSPVQTLETALAKAKNMDGPKIQIIIRSGVYHLSNPLVITSDDFKEKKLLISAYKDEQVYVSGGQKLKLNWKKWRGECLQSKVCITNFDQLFISGKKRILARYPDFKQNEIFNGYASDAISGDRVRSWNNPEGGFVHAMHEGQWGDMHYVITGKKDDNLTLEGGFQNNRPSKMHENYRFVENILEELDSPGEWFLDKKEGILYYFPIEGEDLNNSNVEVSILPDLIELKGKIDSPVKNITIQNLHFLHTSRTFMKPYEPLTRSDWRIYRGAAIFLENAEDCTISSCEFSNLGGNAVFLSKYNQGCIFKGNHIHDIGASAICVVGDSSAVRSASFAYEESIPYTEMDKTPGPANGLYPRHCTIEDNLIHDIGTVEKQVAGVQIQVAAEINVLHNSIYRVPRAGINIGDGAFGGHIIEYNDVFDTVLETSDHGAFNSWGRNRFWISDYNAMAKLATVHPELILSDAIYTTIIRYNRFRCDHGWDIDLDDGSSNYHIYKNLCLNGGIKLREGFYRTVENNTIVNNSLHPHVWFENSGDIIQNNIFMEPYHDIRLNGWGKLVDYNLFMNAEDLAVAHKNGTDMHSISSELEFRNNFDGDFTIINKEDALRIGFENFPMDKFGVFSPELLKIAEKPIISKIKSDHIEAENKESLWLGATVREVKGLGDRSAYGLPDEYGVIIINTNDNEIFKSSGIQTGDVIVKVKQTIITSVDQLKLLIDKEKQKHKIPVQIYRNQQLMNKSLVVE